MSEFDGLYVLSFNGTPVQPLYIFRSIAEAQAWVAALVEGVEWVGNETVQYSNKFDDPTAGNKGQKLQLRIDQMSALVGRAQLVHLLGKRA